MAAAPFLLSLPPGWRLAGEPAALVAAGEEPLALPGPAAVAAARRLVAGDASEEELARGAVTGGSAALGHLYALLFALHDRRLLRRGVAAAGAPLLTAVPISAACPLGGEAVAPDATRRLSRFALARRVDDELVLESPLGLARVILHGPRALALLAALVRPRRPAEVAVEAGLEAATAELALALLDHAGLLATPAEAAEPLASWEFHDLLFHARSRLGRHFGGYGARLAPGTPPPALRPDHEGEVVALGRPDLAALLAADPPFARVLEERRSCRRFGERAIGREELGELLFRALRVREVAAVEGAATQIARRPFPGGGGAYELEVYLVVGRCRDLAAGLYHYRPRAHELVKVREGTPEVERLLAAAARIGRTAGPVQVMVVLAARFGRLSFKYQSMVYATVLKDVGVVMQTLYLAATAMGLGVCALGGGDSDLFARAAGLDGWEEGAVGELIVGSLP